MASSRPAVIEGNGSEVQAKPKVRNRSASLGQERTEGMEHEKKSARISGFLFSALAYQNLLPTKGSEGEGFLLGEISGALNNNFMNFSLSDVQVVHTINLQRYIPCNPHFSFHNSSGEVNVQALKKMIPCYEKNVIGWYKFRRNSSLKVTPRERVLHQNLQQHFSNRGLLFLLLTSNLARGNGSTHVLDHGLYRFQDGVFQQIPLVVTNLGMSEHQAYKIVSGTCRSTAFGRVAHSCGSEFFNTDGTVKEARRMSEFYLTVENKLKEVCAETAHSEQLVKNLIDEVNKLKEEIAVKRMNNEEPGEKSEEAKAKELCQALHTFFPSQEFVHSCSACAKGKRIARRGYDSKSKLKSVTELTLLVENPKFPEADEARATIRQEFLAPEKPPLAMKAGASKQRDEEKADEARATIMQESLETENPPSRMEAEAWRQTNWRAGTSTQWTEN